MKQEDVAKAGSAAPYVPAHRRAISTLFLLNGIMIGVWAAHVPVVQQHAGIDTGVLGFLLLTIAGGAISAMPLAGVLLGRWGTRPLALVAGCLFAAACAALMSVTHVAALFAAGYAFGFTNGTLGVSINANASEVETARGIPTMSSIHGFWSLGGLLGAALGGVLIGAGLGDGRGAMLAAAVMAVAVLVCAPRLLTTPPAAKQASQQGSHFALPRGPALFLGLLALLSFAVEGALVDWSALLVTSRTGVSAASAALGYSAFSITMAACRFLGDGLVQRFGALRVLRFGGLGLCCGLMLAVVSTQLWLSALGFALIGLSAANVVPVLFSAASRIPGMSTGGGLATVATLGSAGLLLAPPLIGSIAAHTSLAVALGLLSLSGLVIALNARIVVR